MEDVDKIINKWEGLGFLEGFTNKKNGAIAYELLAHILLTDIEGDKRYDERLTTVMFPVVSRVLREYEEDLNLDDIREIVMELLLGFPLHELDSKEAAIMHKNYIDYEAEVIYEYCLQYSSQRN
jgi:hypothetical protein